MKLSDHSAHISSFQVLEVLKQVTALEKEGMDTIRLFVGEPDFGTPDAIRDRGIEALQNLPQGYTSSTGIPQLKEKIADRYKRWHGLDIAPERIIVTPSGSTALHLVFLATLNPGDEVLIPEPGYPCNPNILTMTHAKAVSVPLDADKGMTLSLDSLKKAITDKTRAIMLASPSNPLGSILSLAEWRDLSAFCKTNDLHLMADEIYHGLTFDGLAPSALEASNDTWIIQSFSKFYGMTGWRLGWAVVPEHTIETVERIAQNLYLSAPTVSQQAALAAFEPTVEALCFERRDELKVRRDYLIGALPDLGLRVMASPDGAFYLYVDISNYSYDALSFCSDLLNETGIAVTPGDDFGGPMSNSSVRIAYTVGVSRLQEAIKRLKNYLEKRELKSP